MSGNTILAFGDSLTSGWYNYGRKERPYAEALQALLNEHHHDFSVEVQGVPGEETSEMAPRLADLLKEAARNNFKYSHIVILGGTNDIGHKNYDAIFANLKEMYSLVEKHGAKLVCVTVPGSEYNESNFVRNRENLNDLIRKYVSEKKGAVKLVDLFNGIPYAHGDQAEIKKFWDDGLHFSPAGYDKFGLLVFEALSF